ncbi:MAG: hypothetical protein R2909_22620 [Gemmatimonadales bacterium]
MIRRTRWPLLALATLATACRLAAADHERLGDDAYANGEFDLAATEYQAAAKVGSRSRIWAKTGAAALRAHQYSLAVDAFASLAESDPTRATEAAVGLERVVDAAGRSGTVDPSVVSRAVLAVRRIAPTRPLGRLAELPVGAADLDPTTLLGLLPAALASAGSRSAVDSLLARYADALRTTTACDAAARGYQALLRRAERGNLRRTARDGVAFCGLLLGLDALNAKDGATAERWFEAVIAVEPTSERGWRAQIGRGDARLLAGDALGASVAYQTVLGAGAVSDSLKSLASSRLNALGSAQPDQTAGGTP